jgi:hypothetical protein
MYNLFKMGTVLVTPFVLNNPPTINVLEVRRWLEENATEKHKQHFDKVLMIVNACPSEQEFKDLLANSFSKNYLTSSLTQLNQVTPSSRVSFDTRFSVSKSLETIPNEASPPT